MKYFIAISALVFVPIMANAEPTGPVYVISVGTNAAPGGSAGKGLTPLQYADDDAASIYSFYAKATKQATLLATLDANTQKRFPGIASLARSPSLEELRKVLIATAKDMELDRKRQQEPTLLFFYSGHGVLDPTLGAALTFQNGLLSQEMLYQEILERFPDTNVHLIVDACHAEGVVRPRGEDSKTESKISKLTAKDQDAWKKSRTLDGYPKAGAIIATATNQQAHEWSVYQQGVFTHEVLSGLRGGADVNHDARIEYSELQAFLSAANRQVKDPRGQLRVLVHPPAGNLRAVLADLSAFPNLAMLKGSPKALGAFHVEDEQGVRLLDLNTEPGFEVSLALPAQQTLFLRSDVGEASFQLLPGEQRSIEQLNLAPAVTASRGSISASFWEGLFKTPFGPSYYLGFTDQVGIVPIPLDRQASTASSPNLVATAQPTATVSSRDWGASLPTERVETYVLGDGLRILVARASTEAEAVPLCAAMEAALRASKKVKLVMNSQALGDLAAQDDTAIVKKAGAFPIDLVAVVRVMQSASGQFDQAMITIYNKESKVIGAFTADKGKPILAQASSGNVGAGVGTKAADTVATIIKDTTDDKKNALEQFENQKIEFTSVVVAAGGYVGVFTSPPLYGKLHKEMEWGEYYQKVGRPDLASSFETRRGVRIGLSVIGWSAFLAGGVVMMLPLVSDDYEVTNEYGSKSMDMKYVIIGGVIMGAGGLFGTIAGFMNSQPVSASEAYSLAEGYNEKLKKDLGLIDEPTAEKKPSRAGAPFDLSIAPMPLSNGGGLMLGGRF